MCIDVCVRICMHMFVYAYINKDMHLKIVKMNGVLGHLCAHIC